MLVKICGITRADDAEVAVTAGARAVGFVFWQGSPRFIDPYRARAIIRELPAFVTTVGVFVNQALSDVNAIAAIARVSTVQLHGDEDPEFAAGVSRPVLKAVSHPVDLSAAAAMWPKRVVLLVDAADRARRGGTGRLADWGAAADLARQRPLLLAGGLSPENVGEAIAAVHPYGIDVSSGVERSPGIKDHARIRALFGAL